MKRNLLFILCLISISILVNAQDWTAMGPMSGKFSSVEWSKHNEDVLYASNNYTLFKSEDHGESWNVLFSFGIDQFQYMTIHNITMDNSDENTIYLNAEITFDPSLPQNGIYKSVDGGQTFDQIHQAPTEGFIIHPVTGKIASFKDGDDGNFYISENNGDSFTQYFNIPNRLQGLAFDPADDDIIYATTYYGVYKTIDGGDNWTLIGFEDENLEMCVSHPTNSGEVWVGSPFFGDEFLYKTLDGGDNWILVELPYTDSVADHPRHVVWGNISDKIYVTEMNEIFVSNDNGETWGSTSFDIDTEFFYPLDFALNPFNNDELIVASDALAVETTDGGESYEMFSITAGSTDVIETVENPTGGYYIYAGNGWGLNRYNTEEEIWEDFTEPGMIGVGIKALSTDPAQPGFLLKGVRNALNNALLYKSNDFGTSFELVWDNLEDFGGFTTEIEQSFSEEGVFYLSTWSEGIPAQLARSEDNGETWTVISDNNETHYNMTDVVISYQNPDIIFTFGDGVIQKSTDRGETWMPMYNGVPFEGVYDGTIDPYDDNHLYASVSAGIYETTDGGENWIQVSEESAKIIEFNPVLPGLVTAVTFNNDVLISFDNGSNWESYLGDIQSASFTDVSYSPDGTTLLVGTTSQGIYSTPLDASYIIPQNLTVSVTGFNAELNWESVSGVTTYSIYQNGIKIDEVSDNTYTDFYLIPGDYEYAVASILNGVEGELSNIAFAYVGGSDLAIPTNLSAEITDFRDITLSWEEPVVTPQSEWFAYDSGEYSGTFSTMIGGSFDVCIKFDPEDLTDYDGYLLSQIQFIPLASFYTYSLKILSGENGETVEVNQSITNFTENEWNIFELDTPHVIDASQPLYFGFYVESFSMIGTHDAGPAVASGKSDLLGMGGTWYTLADMGIDANWNIQGLVESPSQREDRITLQQYLNRDMTGFNIYKEGELFTEISDPATFSYVDADNEFGTYHYAVTADYDEGESVPSNEEIVMLEDPFNPPTGLEYSIENENDVILNWEAPEFIIPDVSLAYGDQIEGGIYNAFIGGNFDFAVRFPAETMNQYLDYNLSSISFKPVNNIGSYTLKVWTGEGDEVLSTPLSDLTYGEINTIVLDNPVAVTLDTDLWFGFNIDHFGGNVFNYSSDAAVAPGYSNLAGMYGSWMTLADFGYDANNMITGTLTSSTRELPVVLGYEVFKNDESLVVIDDAETLTITDEDIAFDTAISYAVTALFDDNESSVLSNVVNVNIPSPYIAPINLTAAGGTNDVEITWEMAEDVYNLTWNSGICTDGVGLTNGGVVIAGIRFATENLVDLNGASIRRVYYFPREAYDTTIQIRTGENGENIIYEQEVDTVVPMEWNEVILDEEVVIDNSEELWLSYKMVDTVADIYPIGLDAGPAVEAFGDLVSADNGETWLVLSWNGINANVCLSAEAVTTTGERVQISRFVTDIDNGKFQPATNFSSTNLGLRDLREVEITSFKIYRDNQLLTEITDPTARSYAEGFINAGTYEYKVTAVYDNEVESPFSNIAIAEVDGVDSENDEIPSVNQLTGNYPNPFNPETSINFAMASPGKVTIDIFNSKGQKVIRLVENNFDAGYHSTVWNGRDDKNRKVASGIFFYRMTTKDFTSTRKMLLLK